MTSNNGLHQTHLSIGIRAFRWLHSRLYFIPIVALVVIVVILGTHLDFSQIIGNPTMLIVGGAGLLVGLHVAGVAIFAFMAQRRRLARQFANRSKEGPESDQHRHNDTRHHHHHYEDDVILETSGMTIPWASFYDRLVSLIWFGKEKSIREQIVDLAQLKSGEKVLDVGCGTGSLALIAKTQVGPTGQVYGTDASPQMIDVAQKKAAQAGVDVTFQVDLIESITFPDNQFDVVLSSFMMHHLPDDLKRKGLAEIHRVLKPGGRIFIVDVESSSGGNLFQKLSDLMVQLHGGHSIMQNNVKKLIPLLETAGFTVVTTDRINRQMSYLVGEKVPANVKV